MSKQLVIILGPHAVGKMTVGQELAKITAGHKAPPYKLLAEKQTDRRGRRSLR